MTDHPSAHTRTQYLRGLLPPEEFLEVDDHLAGCQECREAIAPPLSRVAESLRDGVMGEHIEYEQLEAYVEGTLTGDETTTAETHIAACEMCAEEVDDLRRAAKGWQPQRWLLWAAAAVIVLLLGSVILLRQPPPNPPEAPVPPQTASTAPPQVPIASTPEMNAALKHVLAQLADGVLPSAALIQDLRPAGERIRGEGEEGAALTIAAPRGVVEEVKPLFRWNARRGGTYVVEVFDSSYQRVARSNALERGEWLPPRPLRRDSVYSWQVTEKHGANEVTAPAPPEPPARFKIISETAAAELQAARTSRAHLAAGLAYAREGIVDRALAEMALAGKERPQSAEIRRAIETLQRYQPAPTTTNPPQ